MARALREGGRAEEVGKEEEEEDNKNNNGCNKAAGDKEEADATGGIANEGGSSGVARPVAQTGNEDGENMCLWREGRGTGATGIESPPC